MYVVVRRYAGGAGGAETEERARRIREGFLPLLRRQAGFRAYLMLRDGEGGATSVIVFDRPEDAVAAHHDIRRWALANLHDLTPGPPDLLSGEVPQDGLAPREFGPTPHVTVTVFDGLPPAERRPERERLRSALAGQPGFRGLYAFRGEAAPARWIGVGVFDGPEAAAAVGRRLRDAIGGLPAGGAIPLRQGGGPALVAEMA